MHKLLIEDHSGNVCELRVEVCLWEGIMGCSMRSIEKGSLSFLYISLIGVLLPGNG